MKRFRLASFELTFLTILYSTYGEKFMEKIASNDNTQHKTDTNYSLFCY